MNHRCFNCKAKLVREESADIIQENNILQAYVCNDCGNIYFEAMIGKKVNSSNGRDNNYKGDRELYNWCFGK